MRLYSCTWFVNIWTHKRNYMLIGIKEKLLRLQTNFQPLMVDGVPRRIRETYKRYDEIRGYGAYLERCQNACKRPLPKSYDSLSSNHYDLIDVYSQETAEAVRQEAELLSGEYTRRNSANNSVAMTISDGEFFDKVMEAVFTEETDAKLLNFFGSEYVPYWYRMTHTEPNNAGKRSFLWHCDKGPKKWAKILLYFTNVSDTGGNTFMLTKNTTDAISALDYTFGPANKRTSDLEGMAKQNNIEFEQISFDVNAGQAVLFEPGTLLHRGKLPEHARRTIMQILILPSPKPWREALPMLRIANLKSRNDYDFPGHADDLEAALT